MNPLTYPIPVRPKQRLLSIAHSYAVGQNRRLVHEMTVAGKQKWDVHSVAPRFFHGKNDLRPVTFEPTHDDDIQRLEIVPAYFTRHVHFFLYGRRLKSILRQGWDLVHCWEEPYILAGSQVGKWTPPGTPLVYRTAQSLDKRYPPPFNWLEAANMRRAAGWICSGTLVAKTLGAKPIYRDRPSQLIPLGVDMNHFRPDPVAKRQTLAELNFGGDAPVVGYLGRFVAAKGLDLMMNALDGLATPWHALFIGAGPMQSRLEKWATRYPDRVRIRNDVRHDQVNNYLNAMDVMLAPSQTTPTWREQFGRMLVEAFACGVPVIGSDSGEVPFVIGDSGVVCPEGDVAAWTRAIETLLSDPDRRRELGHRGLNKAATQFSWPVVARLHLDFFERILESRTTTN